MPKLPKPTFKSTFGKSFATVAKKKGIIRTGDKKPTNRKMGVLEGKLQDPIRQLEKNKSKLRFESFRKEMQRREALRKKRQTIILENKLNDMLIKNKKEPISKIINKLVKENNQGKENKLINEFVHSNILDVTREYIRTSRPAIDGPEYLVPGDVIAIVKRTIRKI